MYDLFVDVSLVAFLIDMWTQWMPFQPAGHCCLTDMSASLGLQCLWLDLPVAKSISSVPMTHDGPTETHILDDLVGFHVVVARFSSPCPRGGHDVHMEVTWDTLRDTRPSRVRRVPSWWILDSNLPSSLCLFMVRRMFMVVQPPQQCGCDIS
jgi:hypothetical protein